MQLKNSSDNLVSKYVQEISPIEYESTKIKNKLLDGSYHVQTVGDPQPYVNVEVFVNELQLDSINLGQANGEIFTLIKDDVSYTGYIDEPVQWARKTPRWTKENVLYLGIFKFYINEIGEL